MAYVYKQHLHIYMLLFLGLVLKSDWFQILPSYMYMLLLKLLILCWEYGHTIYTLRDPWARSRAAMNINSHGGWCM